MCSFELYFFSFLMQETQGFCYNFVHAYNLKKVFWRCFVLKLHNSLGEELSFKNEHIYWIPAIKLLTNLLYNYNSTKQRYSGIDNSSKDEAGRNSFLKT